MAEDDIKRIEEAIISLNKKFDYFLSQYELDMRGDMDSSNGGSRGVIGEIRLMKRYQKEYPSLLWLIKNSPVKTIATLLVIFVFLMTLYQFGMMEFLLAYFGVPIP